MEKATGVRLTEDQERLMSINVIKLESIFRQSKLVVQFMDKTYLRKKNQSGYF